jgi:hypothetical protein
LEYRPTSPGRLGDLWIEYFQCLKFEFDIASTFTRKDENTVKLEVNYAPGGTQIKEGDVGAKAPAFDGEHTDKSAPAPAPEPLCPVAPAVTLKIDPMQSGMNSTFKVSVTPPTPGLFFLWEVQDALPDIGNGAGIKTQFRTQGPKRVTVSAFTKDGCSVSQSFQVEIVG